MKPKMELTGEILRSLLSYDPVSGRLTWVPRGVEMFSTAEHQRGWNARYAGKEAFTANFCGYKCGGIFGKRYLAHRIIWLMQTDAWPDEVDHISGDRSDNRWCNLRNVTGRENRKNQKLRSNNRSGVMGVIWDERRNSWRAQVRVDGTSKHLGYFPDLASAVAARASADCTHGFHPNHGRSA